MTGVDAMIASGLLIRIVWAPMAGRMAAYTFWILTQTESLQSGLARAGLSNIYRLFTETTFRYLRWFYSDKAPWEQLSCTGIARPDESTSECQNSHDDYARAGWTPACPSRRRRNSIWR